ncbi:hypothetical protein AMATHDRAFT_68153 [Amanita thiersii Skay4041]|uniref:PIPK domain-containing protein n=1 Tax=Amanita thiersii Skay4041 TaxID=703135 RepID=A0A2A9NHN8_9AGAR|nr:hypothetical protein AMATHDRAFT_68153 [Amanita thiersii Skay4041]
MASQKPLPDIPIHAQLTKLAIETRNHRADVIRHILSGTEDASIERRTDEWAHAIEDGLDDLSQSIAHEDWFGGFKRRKEAARRADQLVRDEDMAFLMGTRRVSSTSSTASQSSLDICPPTRNSVDHSDKTHILLQMRKFTSQPTNSSKDLDVKHLVLCVAPFGAQFPVSPEGVGLHGFPTTISCIYVPGVFAMAPDVHSPTSPILFGLDDWESMVNLSKEYSLRIVGGTFVLRGTTSPSQHHVLTQVLRASVYIHLSLLLEQHILADSNVFLQYPRPSLQSPVPSVPESVHSNVETKSKTRSSLLPSSVLNFFSKTRSHRSTTISPIVGRGGSLDLGLKIPLSRSHGDESPRSSLDSIGQRIRRMSMRGEAFHLRSRRRADDPNKPYSSALVRIKDSCNRLSTSFDISFNPPSLITYLTQKEEQEQGCRIKGKEKAGLLALLGWEGKESMGRGMSGIIGFVRQQGFSALVSRSVVQRLLPPNDENSQEIARVACGRPRWITYWYYSKGARRDLTLGELLTDLFTSYSLPCGEPTCQYKFGQHQISFIHNNTRIDVNCHDKNDEPASTVEDVVLMWESCIVCSARSDPRVMNDGSYLLSFAKFLELIVYSPSFHYLTPTICEHTARISGSPSSTPSSTRCNVIRHFATSTCVVVFSQLEVKDVYELQLPRLQMSRSGEKPIHPLSEEGNNSEEQYDEDRSVLRRQIKTWWESVSDHLDKIESALSSCESDVTLKALPRLPSSDEAYEDIGSPLTIKGSHPSSLHPSEYPGTSSGETDSTISQINFENANTTLPNIVVDPLILLSSMRTTFQRTEQSLYAQLSHTPTTKLNNVRRAFLSAARGAHKRLMAWQKKHLIANVIDDLVTKEPDWWDPKSHAFPEGNVLVREKDWGSIIAFTLSSPEFLQELSNMLVNRSPSGSNALSIPESTSFSQPQTPSLLAAAVKGYNFFSTTNQPQLDPDQEGVIWHESETYTAVATRKEFSRDTASLLSLRDVLRVKGSNDGIVNSRFNSLGLSTSKSVGPTPPSAWAKPEVHLSMEAAGGEVTGLPDTVETAGKILQELEATSAEIVRSVPVVTESPISSPPSTIRRIRRGSIDSSSSNSTIGPHPFPPEPPPKDLPGPLSPHELHRPMTPNQSRLQSTFVSTLSSSFSYAMRLVSSGQSTPRQTPKPHHGLLLADSSTIDERPHIKYEMTVGKRVKFTCTVYYAKQFESLRRRCGVDDVFVRSLSQSNNWAAEGGKSRSNFWKTSDDRFVIKTLVNAWNVADLQVLLEIAPSYFRYMDTTASKPTVIVKLLGFYTIEVKNLESGATTSKIDLLVMENLFYNRKVDRMFDLKGIQARKVKAAGTGESSEARRKRTLFDGEWIEDQQRTLMLVRPEFKKALQEALRSDADFLARMNIMDYSLLLGIDVEGKQLFCGLVDTIGSFTFAKTLEYKAKHGLQSGKDTTVMPPAEYQERFVNALESYFVACPDKWSKPLDESRIPNTVDQLPSVL